MAVPIIRAGLSREEKEMPTEQEKTLDALQIALKMETDGKQFYLKASSQAANQPGKKLFKTLADEEDIHARKFTEIYQAMTSQKPWPRTDFKPDGGRHLRTVFAAALGEPVRQTAKGAESEVAAALTALDMENKTFDFYQKRAGTAGFPLERDFYGALASQEKEHQLILQDYYEFLQDPAAWYVKIERPSLDGV